MPGSIHNKDFDIEQLKERIAIIEDNPYSTGHGRVPDPEIQVPVRNRGFARHTFLGLHGFLLEMFKQFKEILGVRTNDSMSTSDSGLPDALANYLQ